MALNLHPECRTRLVEKLVEGLPKIETQNGMFLDRESQVPALLAANQVLPKTGRLRDQLVAYVDEYPILDFVGETLSTELLERDQYLRDTPSIKLIDIEGYGDTQKVAQSLVERFESLPWQYTLSVELPADVSAVFSRLGAEFPLSDQMRLVCPTADFIARYPLKSKDENRHKRIHARGGTLLGGPPADPEWNGGSVYLLVDTEGFIGTYGSTKPAWDAMAMLRAFCGCAVALRLFQIERVYTALVLGGGPRKSHFFVHKKSNDVWEIDGKIVLEDHHAATFNFIKLDELGGKIDNEGKKAAWAARQLSRMRILFSSGENGTKIVRASRWLFDSYTGQDELLSFVQSMIVLEILLGDKETSNEIGLGELLRNRCAYLIGNSHKQRSELLREFNEIYRVRSQIVHSGKSRLTARERLLFNKLRWMCSRVIQAEIDLLKADLEEVK